MCCIFCVNCIECIDLVLEGNGLRFCYIVVENVIFEKEIVVCFLDVKYFQGIDVIQNLMNLVCEGNCGMVIFVVQRSDVELFEFVD